MRVKTTSLMETPGPRGTNHSHVTSSGASMKITPLQWPVILISALGKSGRDPQGGLSMSKQRGMRGIQRSQGRKEKRRKREAGERWRITQWWCSLFLCVSSCSSLISAASHLKNNNLSMTSSALSEMSEGLSPGWEMYLSVSNAVINKASSIYVHVSYSKK